jgi:hypothetical protein
MVTGTISFATFSTPYLWQSLVPDANGVVRRLNVQIPPVKLVSITLVPKTLDGSLRGMGSSFVVIVIMDLKLKR